MILIRLDKRRIFFCKKSNLLIENDRLNRIHGIHGIIFARKTLMIIL
jgi:hypothetical protein